MEVDNVCYVPLAIFHLFLSANYYCGIYQDEDSVMRLKALEEDSKETMSWDCFVKLVLLCFVLMDIIFLCRL